MLINLCVPTFNRHQYLRELLESIDVARDAAGGDRGRCEVTVYDNNSEPPVIVSAERTTLVRHPHNLGADRNIHAASSSGRGDYTWVVGDDELLLPDSLAALYRALHTHQPALAIQLDPSYPVHPKLVGLHASYRDFALSAIAHQPHLLIAHTLISCNLFRSDRYDRELVDMTLVHVRSLLDTPCHFHHMFGIINGMVRAGGSVLVADRPTFRVRTRRAKSVGDGLDYDLLYRSYACWLIDRLGLDVDPNWLFAKVKMRRSWWQRACAICVH